MLEKDEEAGKEALRYLNRSAEVPSDVAKQCMELVAKTRKLDSKETQDGIVAGLLRESPAARTFLAKRLHEDSTSVVFEEIYDLGDGAASGIVAVVLDLSVWSTQAMREICEKDVFQLYLAKLLEVGDDYNGRAIKGIARFLATGVERLHSIVDEETFDAILNSLDVRNSIDVRSAATLATAKYLEASEENGQKFLSQYIATRVAKQKNEDLILAFSAAAGIFPVAPSTASSLFLTEGFVQSLVPLLEKKAKSDKVEKAALSMLNAACIDSACREAIHKHCLDWLHHVLETGRDQKPGLAAVILAKSQGPSLQNGSKVRVSPEEDESINSVVPRLQRMMLDTEGNKQASIEGLAYASVQPKVKEQLLKDKAFLSNFLQALKDSPSGSSAAFGGLTVIDNLTRYLPNLSEEQKRISQLRAYANASKSPQQTDYLDEEAAVTERCKTVMSAGTIPVLLAISKNLSPGSIAIMFNILLSLSRTTSLRGTIAQQGGLKLLLQDYTVMTGSSNTEAQSRRTAAHALARILISVNPSLVFPTSGSISMTSAIRPLLTLLTEDQSLATEGPRDLLPTFEALLALTNLASDPSSGVCELIIRLAFPTVQDLLLSSNVQVRRAAVELVCNLVTCPAGIDLFADNSKPAATRMHILLAMADVDDRATRSAAGGALAGLSEFEGAVNAILGRKRGVQILLDLCDGNDADEGLTYRGVVCITNMISTGGDLGNQARRQIKALRGETILRTATQRFSKNDGILQCGVHALTALKSVNGI